MPWIVPSEESICGPGSHSEVKVVRNADKEFKFKTLVVQGRLQAGNSLCVPHSKSAMHPGHNAESNLGSTNLG